MGKLIFFKARTDSYRDPVTYAIIEACGYRGAWTVEALKAFAADNIRWRKSDPAAGGIACSTSEEVSRISAAVGMTPAELLHLADKLADLEVIDSGRWRRDQVIAFTDPLYCDGIDRCIEWRRAVATGGEAGAGIPKARERDGWTPWMTRTAMAGLLQVHPDTVSRKAQRGDIQRQRFVHGVRYRVELQDDHVAGENDIENDDRASGLSYAANDIGFSKGDKALSIPEDNIIPRMGSAEGGDIADGSSSDIIADQVEPTETGININDGTACEDRPGYTYGANSGQGAMLLAESALNATKQAQEARADAEKTPAGSFGSVVQWAVVITDLLAAGADLGELHRRVEAYIHEPGGLTWTPHREFVDSPAAFRRALQGRSILVSLDRWRKARGAAASGDQGRGSGYTRDVTTSWKELAAARPPEADRVNDEQEQEARQRLLALEQQEQALQLKVASAMEYRELFVLRAELGKVRRLRTILEEIIGSGAA